MINTPPASETPETDAAQRIQFEGRTVCVVAPEDLEALERRLREAGERGSKFQAAIEWALGQGDSDFEPRRLDDPPYYWRTKLRKLAFGSLTYNKETRTISTEAAERRNEGMVLVPIRKLEEIEDYWNGNHNDRAMLDALEHMISEIRGLRFAAPPESGKGK